jgi:hypothetical protein
MFVCASKSLSQLIFNKRGEEMLSPTNFNGQGEREREGRGRNKLGLQGEFPGNGDMILKKKRVTRVLE